MILPTTLILVVGFYVSMNLLYTKNYSELLIFQIYSCYPQQDNRLIFLTICYNFACTIPYSSQGRSAHPRKKGGEIMVSYDSANLALNFGVYTLTLISVIIALLALNKKK